MYHTCEGGKGGTALKCLSPAEIAELTTASGEKKVGLSFRRLAVVGVLAGAYVAFGAEAYLLVLSDTAAFLGFGLSRILGGLFLKRVPSVVAAAGGVPGFQQLTWVHGFLLGNLLPMTLGNLVGGVLFVAVPYWLTYARSTENP
jgi:formate/nitrite transporter FocA (FNT family)